jgi:hypothetical protein
MNSLCYAVQIDALGDLEKPVGTGNELADLHVFGFGFSGLSVMRKFAVQTLHIPWSYSQPILALASRISFETARRSASGALPVVKRLSSLRADRMALLG